MIFSHLWLEISVNFGDFMSQVTFFDCSLSTRSLLSVFYTGHEMSIPMANGPIQLQFSPRFTNRKFPFLFVPDHWAAFLSLSMSKNSKEQMRLDSTLYRRKEKSRRENSFSRETPLSISELLFPLWKWARTTPLPLLEVEKLMMVLLSY